MRHDDDDAVAGSAGGPLADGLGEIIGSGGSSATGDPLGDGASPGEGTFGDGILAESSSPLEGIGYVLDELHGALFGDDEADAADEAVNAALSHDLADIETDTDLDLSGDGVVDPDDLDEAGSPFDFGVDAHGG